MEISSESVGHCLAHHNCARPLLITAGVPELKDVKGKAIFAPYERLSKEEFEKLGYPKPHVDWKETKQRAIERFKSDMRDASP